MTKQKTIRVSDPDLFRECRALLETEFGSTITDAQVIQSGLCWLKLGRTTKLIPFDEAAEQAKAGYLPHVCQTVAQALNLLMDCNLLVPGDYCVEGNQGSLQVRITKDGEVLKPDPDTESPAAPDWMDGLPDQKLALN